MKIQAELPSRKAAENIYDIAKSYGVPTQARYKMTFKRGWYCAIDRWGEFNIYPMENPTYKTVPIKNFIEAILRYKNNEGKR